MRTPTQLREDAQQIWWAGVESVLPERLISKVVTVDGPTLRIGDDSYDLDRIRRIAIIGAGKAAGAMTVAIENALGEEILNDKQVSGWVIVPTDCVVPTRRVTLHAGRPAGVNEPCEEGVVGTRKILEIVSSLTPEDLCIGLITGGGSALLVAPVPEITLEQKVRITQLMSAAGGNIEQLNTVRRSLSLVKGGGLAGACKAGTLITLIISDVLGDSLDTIASGPTTISSTTAQDAIDVLAQLDLTRVPDAQSVVACLKTRVASPNAITASQIFFRQPKNLIIANNAIAVDAAGMEAERLGYSHAMVSATAPEGPAEEVGRHLARIALRMRDEPGPDCLISGGEPVVHLVEESVRGKGGRNQQLALAALEELGDCKNIAILSGGTDGEDGPTDAAGAIIDEQITKVANNVGLDASNHLRRNDAYHFFDSASGLFKTGPTQTNVCDLRVVTVAQNENT